MDDFTQFQLKEYENISQAHFKTNEVLAAFYRYFFIIAAIPVTTIGLALVNISEHQLSSEGRFLAFWLFGVSSVLLSIVGVAVISYIEGLRLDAILYARVVNSIRHFFFLQGGHESFGEPVLPIDRNAPDYGGFGSSFIIYHACALMNAVYFGFGVLALQIDQDKPVTSLNFTNGQWLIFLGCAAALFLLQIIVRHVLIWLKNKRGV